MTTMDGMRCTCARQPARQAPFAEVRDQVERDYIDSMRSRQNADALASSCSQFSIERP